MTKKENLKSSSSSNTGGVSEEAEALIGLVINQLPGYGVLWKDPKGVILGCNEAFAQIVGLRSASEITGKRSSDLWPKDVAEGFRADDERVLKDGQLLRSEKELMLTSGEKRWFETLKAPIRNRSGEIIAIVGIARDISAQKRADAAIRSSQKLESLGVLAGGIAHDFNNMLVGVLGNASIAMKKLPEDSEVRKFIEEIVLSAQNASKLTGQLLAYSGKGRFVVQAIDLNQQITKIEQLVRLSVSKKAELVLELQENVPPINADPTQIHQVIMNLVTNASEALEDKQGKVTVSTGIRTLTPQQETPIFSNYQIESGRYVYIRVTDTGCGMSPKMVDRIFDPFYTTKFTGRGLGLSAVQGIVIAHCGTIHVESTPGKGTSIEVCLPAAEAFAPLRAERPKTKIYKLEPPKPEPGRMSGTVLVVDDEKVVRTVASHILDEFGLKILTAENGQKAIDIYKKNPKSVDVILLDMTMPVMNGVETFKELKKINPDVKVILTSGYSQDEVKLNFENNDDLSGFLEKPFTAQALSTMISEVLLSK